MLKEIALNEQKQKVLDLAKSNTVILIGFTFFSTLFFDLLVSSSSVMPFRLIYDISFVLIMCVFLYVSVHLLRGKMFSGKRFNFIFPRLAIIIPIILNLSAIFSIIWLKVPNIGFLSENVITQGLNGLLPLATFLLIMAANTVILYVNVHGETDIHLYKLAAYVLAVIAIETSLSIYAFHIAGLEGIRWSLSLFHASFIGLTLWSHQRFKTQKIRITITPSDLLLTLLSVGIFAMVYLPFGLYNLYGDNAVVLGGSLSIVHRESLQPYYTISNYYSPITSFISLLFAYITGLDNLLLSSNLPFLLASVMLPFIIYHFLKSFITDDPRIAVTGVIVASLMDGLAIILLPLYAGNITNSMINWNISTATISLYSSNIGHLWLTPYKVFAAVSSIAACSILYKKRVISYVLGGALFFMSFSNPRYAILTILLLILFLGTKKIDLKGLALFTLSVIVFGAPTLPVHLYKQLTALSVSLFQRGFINEVMFIQSSAFLKSLVSYDALLYVIGISLASIIGIIILTRFTSFKQTNTTVFASQFLQREFPTIEFQTRKGKKLLVSSISILLLGLVLILVMYEVFHAYTPEEVINLTNSIFLENLNRIVLRYHILILFFIVGLFGLKYNRRIALTVFLILMVYFFVSTFSLSITLLPILFTILAMPLLISLIKNKRKLAVSCFIFFIFLGVFSATFYSATVTTPTRTDYAGLPHILNILLEKETGTSVYSPSSYTYFAYRVTRMAHLELSSDPSCKLYIIDTDYINSKSLEIYLNDEGFEVLHTGPKFVLLERRHLSS
jgi:hypothetical protein